MTTDQAGTERRNTSTTRKARERMEQDGTTVYTLADPAGIGATVDAAGPAARHVVICGRVGGAASARAWIESTGQWMAAGAPYVGRNNLRASLIGGGRSVTVSSVEPWFGVVEPETAAGAMRYMRHVCAAYGVRPARSPGFTGQRLLAATWEKSGRDWPTVAPDIADLLRTTSGQGRFEVFGANAGGGPLLVGVDARFQYGALAALELPSGVPVELAAGVEPDEWAPSWCHVEFQPAAGAVGLLGVDVGGRHGWSWPTFGGPFTTWCSGAELQLARRGGYRVRVLRAIVWPERSRPLATWATFIGKEREHVEQLPLPAPVIAAARAGLRAMLVQAVGALHSRPSAPGRFVSASVDINRPGAGSFFHPEWSTAIWAAARCRLASRMTEQTAPVVACALDGFYVAGEPVLPADNGKAGQWRETSRRGQWPAVRNMSDIYQLKGAE